LENQLFPVVMPATVCNIRATLERFHAKKLYFLVFSKDYVALHTADVMEEFCDILAA